MGRSPEGHSGLFLLFCLFLAAGGPLLLLPVGGPDVTLF